MEEPSQRMACQRKPFKSILDFIFLTLKACAMRLPWGKRLVFLTKDKSPFMAKKYYSATNPDTLHHAR